MGLDLRKSISVLLLVFLCLINVHLVGADDTDIENKIKEYQQKLIDVRQQKNTLSKQIQEMDTQMYLTGLSIQKSEQKVISTQSEIEKLGSRIDNLDSSLEKLFTQLRQRAIRQYKTQQPSMFDLVFDADSIELLIKKIKYQKSAKENSEKLYIQVQAAKLNYEEQKIIREQKKQELDQLIKNLNAQRESLKTQQNQKQKLLVETNNDESTFQQLLTQAEAQLKNFGKFVVNQGGASLLSNQTICDDWGCYYNQRDSQWGGLSLNNTGYTLASDGCLVTSMAMVYTHFGHRGVTPQTINSNPFNFASYYPAFLSKVITADGATSTRILSSIDDELNAGRPVIVGISYDGGPLPDHFLVLISGSGGNYRMNDPYTPNGHNIPFSDKYSVGSIREIDRINF